MDRISKKVEEQISQNSKDNTAQERTLSKYLIFGSLGSIAFILSVYKDGTSDTSLDVVLSLFSISFLSGIAFLITSLLLSRSISENLLNIFSLQLEMEEREQETSEFDPSLQVFHDSRKVLSAKLGFKGRLEKRVFFFFLFSGASTYIAGFLIAIRQAIFLDGNFQ